MLQTPNIDAGQITQVAQGISEVGFLAISAGAFVLLSVVMMVTMWLWFRSLINSILGDNKHTMGELLTETQKQNAMLVDISEGMRPATMLRIKNLSSVCFELSKEQVLRIIAKVRKENNIADKQRTAKKIRNLLRNLHDDRNSRFDNDTYRGRKLSSYTSEEWIEQVAQVVESEIYNENGANDDRARSNVGLAYDDIKIAFYHNLQRVE